MLLFDSIFPSLVTQSLSVMACCRKVAIILLVLLCGHQGLIVRVWGRTLKCPHFGHRMTKCFGPYLSVAALRIKSDGVRSMPNEVFSKTLCLQFELALVCVHMSLKECPSIHNIRYVQSKLGSDWAIEIRDLCLNQSEASTNHLPKESSKHQETQKQFLREYLTETHPESRKLQSSTQRPSSLKELSFERETVSSKVILVELQRPEVNERRFKSRDSEMQSDLGSVYFNIYDVINKMDSSSTSTGLKSNFSLLKALLLIAIWFDLMHHYW